MKKNILLFLLIATIGLSVIQSHNAPYYLLGYAIITAMSFFWNNTVPINQYRKLEKSLKYSNIQKLKTCHLKKGEEILVKVKGKLYSQSLLNTHITERSNIYSGYSAHKVGYKEDHKGKKYLAPLELLFNSKRVAPKITIQDKTGEIAVNSEQLQFNITNYDNLLNKEKMIYHQEYYWDTQKEAILIGTLKTDGVTRMITLGTDQTSDNILSARYHDDVMKIRRNSSFFTLFLMLILTPLLIVLIISFSSITMIGHSLSISLFDKAPALIEGIPSLTLPISFNPEAIINIDRGDDLALKTFNYFLLFFFIAVPICILLLRISNHHFLSKMIVLAATYSLIPSAICFISAAILHFNTIDLFCAISLVYITSALFSLWHNSRMLIIKRKSEKIPKIKDSLGLIQ